MGETLRRNGRTTRFFSLSVVVCIFAAFFLHPMFVLAKPVGEEEARRAVMGWVRCDRAHLGAALSGEIVAVETYSGDGGRGLYHVVSLRPSGFVILPADDTVEPIIAFSAIGTYEPSEDYPLGAFVGRDVPARVLAGRSLEAAGKEEEEADGRAGERAQLRKAAEKARGRWEQLCDAGEASAMLAGIGEISEVWVAPLVQSTWGQTTVGNYVGGVSCYNYYTPPYSAGNSNNYPCGCVATAMAQLMRFHEHPEGVYVWGNMPLKPDNGITLIQRQAIGQLCYYAAESIDTVYSAGSSTASIEDAGEELKATFEYSNSIRGRYPTMTELREMMNPNLDAGLPVLLGLSSDTGGHSVVCDGYGYNGSTAYHHLNMGWSGTDDVWYALPVVDATYSYNSVHGCIYNVYTSGTGEIVSGRAADMAGNAIAGVSITAQVSGGGTYGATTNASGVYALVNVPSNKSMTITASKAPYSFVSRSVATKTSMSLLSLCGNVWGVDFVSQALSPPIAYDDTASAVSGTTIEITLAGADDGYPNPPGRLAYVIASLPRYGDLADPAGGRIKRVPYTLVNYGNSVRYWPCTYFVGQDSFDFKANDGGTYPQGGDSEAAAVTIDVDNVTTTTFAPDDLLVASWPMKTSSEDSRTQVIYLSNEMGPAKTITALALDIWEAPGQTLNYWTIRMKHTGRSSYASYPLFETSGWTTVYWAHESPTPIGWRTFEFQTPFEYNGYDNLLIDFSHDNSHYTSDGTCSVSDTGADRVVFSYGDSTHGSPLAWSDFSAPGLWTSSGVPNIKLTARVQGEPFVADFVYNCRVDTDDFAVLAAAWLSSPGESNWEEACDISLPADGFINERDYAGFAQYWLDEVE